MGRRAAFIAMTGLQRSHAELRGAVLLAGKPIVKLNSGRREIPFWLFSRV